MALLVEVDSRRRIALGKLGNPDHVRYLVEEQPDGSLLLTPAVVMTQHDAALLKNPEILARIEAELADPESWIHDSAARRPRGAKKTAAGS